MKNYRKLWPAITSGCVCLFILITNGAMADESLVLWDTAGLAGNEISLTGTAQKSGISSALITRGSGLTTSTAAGSFSSAGWEGTESAPTTTEYIEFSVDLGSGSYDLSSLNMAIRASNTGPGTMGLYYNGDSFATAIQTTVVPTSLTDVIFDLSGLANITGVVQFRLIEFGNTQADLRDATASTGTFRVANNSSIGSISLTAVPESHEYAIAIAALLGIVVFIRQRKMATKL
jgi:hypothetical protein